MIKSFKDKDTEKLFNRIPCRKWAKSVCQQALRKLLILDAAEKLIDLKIPPGSHLKALKGDRKGQYSIRINDQYRICFVWENENAYEVEIVNYHI